MSIELQKALSAAWENDRALAVYRGRVDDAYELGFIAAWKISKAPATGQPVELPQVDAHQLHEEITLAEAQLSTLCQTGGRSWSLTIPVKPYDTDIVYANMIRYAKTLLGYLRSPMREAGEDVVPLSALSYRKCDDEYYISGAKLDDNRRRGTDNG
jgi:hypothetical protein